MTSPTPNPTLEPDPEAMGILSRLREAGHEAYFVGGCVRDHLLGREPKDWDIATSARPEDVETLFPRTISVGKAFGVILVHQAGRDYEVATFRGDGIYEDGRRPTEVRFTSLEEDVQRRDFTINALMYDPAESRVIDLVGGRRDIEARVLRTVGEAATRFAEDHLRILRAIRFAAWTGFTIHDDALKAMRSMAPLVARVSPERVGQELTRMLTEGCARRSVELLAEAGLLEHMLPEVARMQGVPQPPQFHPEGDVFVHTVLMLRFADDTFRRSIATAELPDSPGEGRPPNPYLDTANGGSSLVFRCPDEREVLAWAVLLHDAGKPDTMTVSDRIRFNCHDEKSAELAEAALMRLRRPGRIIKPVWELVRRHMRFSSLTEMRQAKRRRFLQDPLFPLHLELHRLDCLASHGKLDHYEYGLSAWLEELAREPEPVPILRGQDLLDLGYRPGPEMGAMLDAVTDAHLEGIVGTREEACEWVLREHPLP